LACFSTGALAYAGAKPQRPRSTGKSYANGKSRSEERLLSLGGNGLFAELAADHTADADEARSQ
jgi:hypothetical protein